MAEIIKGSVVFKHKPEDFIVEEMRGEEVCKISDSVEFLENAPPAEVTDDDFEFDVIVTGSDVKNVKPAPDLYLLAAKKLNVATGECIALEDSETGPASAKSAGIFCIAVPSQYAQNQNFSKADLLVFI